VVVAAEVRGAADFSAVVVAQVITANPRAIAIALDRALLKRISMSKLLRVSIGKQSAWILPQSLWWSKTRYCVN
jgi:hypothetical protein